MFRWLSLENRVWAASFLNVAAMLFQLWAVIEAGSAAGVSRAMLVIFIFVQVSFAQVAQEKKIRAQFLGMVASAVVSVLILALTFVF